ncbi:MAG: hypothetical protein HOG19_13475 [Gammaproteobacteria bacterium]|nr:hypothetical protein [Gammaproteobacteria bacterium]
MSHERADQLLELWARELSKESSNPYPTSILDGNYALAAGGATNWKKQYVTAKETRSPPKAYINTDLLLIDSIVSKIGRVKPGYPLVLKGYYQTGSLKRTAKVLGVSVTKARELKSAAFDMVVALLDER